MRAFQPDGSLAPGFPLNYQWYKDGDLIADAVSDSFIVPSVGIGDAGDYHVVVSNSLDAVSNRLARVTVTGDPVEITQQPTSIVTIETRDEQLEIIASGTPPLTFEWRLDGLPISGADQSTLELTNISFSQSGNYSVEISNPWSSAISDEVSVTVTAAASNPGNLNVHAESLEIPDNVTVTRVRLLEDGRLLVEGNGEVTEGAYAPCLGRLTSTGVVDPRFSAVFDPEVFSGIHILDVLPNGNLLVSVARKHPGNSFYDIYMLSQEGSQLPSFVVPGGIDNRVQRAVVQTTGKVVVCGTFELVGGLARTNIARLNADGTPDSTFSAPHTPGASVHIDRAAR